MIFGRPETFAIEVAALGSGPSGEDPIAASTWTGIKIIVRGRNIFRNLRRDSDAVSDTINWPSVYFARWLVRCWDAIYHTSSWPKPVTLRNARDVAATLDEELADEYDASDEFLDARDKFVQTHSLRAAAAGAAVPDVWLSRDADVVSVAWSDSSDGDFYFPLSRGEADIPAIDFAEAAKGFVAWVRTTIGECGVREASADLTAFDQWLEQFDSPAGAHAALLSEIGVPGQLLAEVRRLAGVKTDRELFDLPQAWFQRGTLADVRASPVALAFRCVAPTVGAGDLVKIREAFLGSDRNPSSFNKLEQLAGGVTPPMQSHQDYVRGYHLARGLRARLRNVSGPLDIEALVSELGLRVSDLELSDTSVDGGCVCDNRHGPAIFTNPKSTRAATAWGKRVVLAHELCHLLFDREHARSIGIFSGPWAPPRVERAANAFAIELLLPLAGIIETVGQAWTNTTDEQVELLMERYGLGLTAVTEHVRNMRRRSNR